MDFARASNVGSLAVWALTPKGINLGKSVCRHLDRARLFVPEKFLDQAVKNRTGQAQAGAGAGKTPQPYQVSPFYSLAQEIAGQFNAYPGHLFIFSTGIAVRMIAPLLRSKTLDPAVMVADELGCHVISLVSGHLGGANEMTLKIADLIHAEPVITTATDLNQVPAIDLIAKEQGLVIETPGAIKQVSMAVLTGRKIHIHDPMNHIRPFFQAAYIQERRGEPGPTISCTWKKTEVSRETLVLRPKVLSVGIGCNRNTPEQEILDLLIQVFQTHKISRQSIQTLASATVKQDEPGLLSLARRLGLGIRFFEKEQLNRVEAVQNPSAMALKHLGVNSVCEAAAILGAQMGRLIVPKHKTRNVTLAVAIVP